jgi:hypothetical protein
MASEQRLLLRRFEEVNTAIVQLQQSMTQRIKELYESQNHSIAELAESLRKEVTPVRIHWQLITRNALNRSFLPEELFRGRVQEVRQSIPW